MIRRRTLFPLIAACVLIGACSSDPDSAQPSTTRASTTTTTLPSTEECTAEARSAAQPLQDFIDQYSGFTAADWNALDPPPDLEPIQDEVIATAQAAVDRGCDPTLVQDALREAIDDLEGRGEVGQAIVAALRGLGPPLGPAQPVPTTTIPRDTRVSIVDVAPGDELAPILARIAPGSTLRFGPGTYEYTEPILVNVDVSFVGAGRDETVLRSTAEGVAVAFVGPGGFELNDMTVEHTGSSEASVLLTIEGPFSVARATIRGGVAGTGEDAGGGHGIVFAFAPIEGFPERTDADRAGALVLDDVVIADNDTAGVLATGDARPKITTSTVTGNGGCGLCYTGTAGGSVTDTTVEANQLGVQAGEASSPVIRSSTFRGNTNAGLSFDGTSTARLIGATVDANGDEGGGVGVQFAGTSTVTVEATTVTGHGVGLLAADAASPTIKATTITANQVGIQANGSGIVTATGNLVVESATAAISLAGTTDGQIADNVVIDALDVGIQVGAAATATITGNRVEAGAGPGLSVLETATATLTGNTLIGRDVGIQLGGSATATVTGNTISASAAVGLLYGGTATGTAQSNTITSTPESIGILVGGSATPTLTENTIDSGATGIVYREDGAGAATFNVVTKHIVGIQVIDRSAPVLDGNTITDSAEAGVVFGGESRAELLRNTIVRNGNVGIQVAESARPTIAGNELRGAGVYGITYRDSAGGRTADNLIADLVFGIQLTGSAAPDLVGNRLENVALTGISYADNSAGSITGTTCSGTSAFGTGISITAPADPTVGENDCSISRAAG